MVGPHGSHPMVATFTEVVPPERLAWVEPATGLRTTSTLEDLGDGTTALVIHQRHVPADADPEARAGFLTSLDALEAHLARSSQRSHHDRPQSWVATTYGGLADLLAAAGDGTGTPPRCARGGGCGTSSRT